MENLGALLARANVDLASADLAVEHEGRTIAVRGEGRRVELRFDELPADPRRAPRFLAQLPLLRRGARLCVDLGFTVEVFSKDRLFARCGAGVEPDLIGAVLRIPAFRLAGSGR